MLNIDTCELENEIVEDLSVELGTDDNFNVLILQKKVKNAVREVYQKRNYTATTMTPEAVVADLYNYYATIRNLALYDYNQVGVEFQTSSTENYTRTYMSRDDIFKGVHAFVNVLF